MKKVTGRNLLMAYVSGDSAIAMEGMSDNAVEAAAMQRLRQAYGIFTPSPISRVITRWNNDPYARGSYSYMKLETNLGDRAILREPVGDRLLFAGEATMDFGFAQVPGAYSSGLREADRLIQVYED